LVSALAPYKNRDAAYALAVFLARYWSVPGKVAGSFPIDRRALVDNANLGLTEAQVRGATRTLAAVGYIERGIPPSGSRFRMTENGDLHRKVILFGFGSEYGPLLIAANKRARAARGGNSRAGRSITPTINPKPPTAILEARTLRSPKSKSEAESYVLMGHLAPENRQPPPPAAFNPLEAALARLKKAIDKSGERESGG
jgi:hypothetical protein